MDYFEAVQEGKSRVKDAIDFLQGVAGVCYPMLFLKLGVPEWTPVGTEMLYTVVQGKSDTAAVIICDADGNSKTMSTWVTSEKAEQYSLSLAGKGLQKFEGEVKLPI